MKKLYTIHPMIMTESLPRYASVASVISDYFYLFNVYSDNPYIVREYMNFIDNEFDFVFRELGYQIAIYEYPDRFEILEEALDYINHKYHLEKDTKLDSGYDINVFNVYDFYRDKEVTIYLNSYTLYDSLYFGMGIFDEDSDIIVNLLAIIPYLIDRETKNTITFLLYRYYDYNDIIVEYLLKSDECYNSNMINEPVFILSQLKSFVNYTVKERIIE